MPAEPAPLTLHPARLLPADPGVREIATRLYDAVQDLPIISPHGHVDPQMLLADKPFTDPTSLLLQPDHYVTRLLHASGVPLDRAGCRPRTAAGAAGASGVAAAVRALATSSAAPRCGTGSTANSSEIFGDHGAAERRQRGRDLRPDQRPPGRGRLPAAGPAGPIRHRGAGHHRRPGRRPRRACGARRRPRLPDPGDPDLPAGPVPGTGAGRLGGCGQATGRRGRRRRRRVRRLHRGAGGAPPVLHLPRGDIGRPQPPRRRRRAAGSR